MTLLLGDRRPAGLMQGYQGDDGSVSGADGDVYRSGDVVFVDDDGYLTFVGRSDDVFKSSDYRISPFELESVLLEHDLVAEAAMVPSPDPIRLAVPKAYVLLVGGRAARSRNGAVDLSASACAACAVQAGAPHRTGQRIAEDDLRQDPPRAIAPARTRRQPRDALRGDEFREEDFPELQAQRAG